MPWIFFRVYLVVGEQLLQQPYLQKWKSHREWQTFLNSQLSLEKEELSWKSHVLFSKLNAKLQ
jgi:hypothetical protein